MDELNKQAVEIIEWSRRKLAMKLPEFLPAIYLLPLKESEEPCSLRTDGAFLFYHPQTVIEDYLARKDSIAHRIMHICAHGLLGHIEKRRGQQEQIFDAAADIKAEAFLNQLPISLSAKLGKEDRYTLASAEDTGLEALYLSPESRQEAQKLVESARNFNVDDHRLWQIPTGKGAGSGNGAWMAAARQVAEALANSNGQFGKGDLAAQLCEEYAAVEESGVSYKEFFQKFCSLRERQETDPNSISSLWYHVGLSLTGDAPFIEPEELREDAPALDIAVALDTSGSCCGKIMKEFIAQLLAMLRDAGGPRVELTLIQCDMEINSVQTLCREDDAESIMNSFSVYGCGGTDFRPVFEYIDEQNSSGEGKKFKGLIYLSDGYGDFPNKAPDYPVVFIFPKDEDAWEWGGFGHIPDWVTRVKITDDDRLVVEN